MRQHSGLPMRVYQTKRSLALQDNKFSISETGNWENITFMVTICTDGSSLAPPAVIFKGNKYLVKRSSRTLQMQFKSRFMWISDQSILSIKKMLGHSQNGWIGNWLYSGLPTSRNVQQGWPTVVWASLLLMATTPTIPFEFLAPSHKQDLSDWWLEARGLRNTEGFVDTRNPGLSRAQLIEHRGS